ncbi:unnamed protein product [Musa textilis]
MAVYNVQLRQPILGEGARVVAITLDQVYMLKVEGIGFRFLPDPLQIKNALALKSADVSRSFGVPVFQSDFLVKKKNKHYCPHILPEGRYRKRASQGFQGIKRIRIFSQHYGVKSGRCSEKLEVKNLH